MFTRSRTKRHQRRRSHNTRSQQIFVESLETRSLLTALVWSDAPALPTPQTDAVAVLGADNAVHLLGGDSASPTSAPQLAPNGTDWVAGHKIDTQRNDLGAVRSGAAIYLFGGTGNTEGSDEVLDYDYFNGDSQDQDKMAMIRYDFGFAADEAGRAYAIGGIGIFDDGETWSEAERFDPATGAWSPIASLPQALRGMSAIGDGNGHIFVFGGSTTLDDTGIQDTTYRYDIASDTWSTVGPMLVGTRDSAAVMDEHGAIYVLGGMTTTGATDAVQVFDPATNTWTSNSPLPAPVYSHAAAYDSQARIIVAGGFDSTGTPTAAVHRSQRLDVAATAPVFRTSPVVSGSLDRPYTYDVDATGNPDPTYSLVTAPTGMTVDTATGMISWQPMEGQLGANAVTVRASNVAGNVDQSFDITVVADTIAPTTPANVAITGVTETTITLSWTASSDAVGVDRYEVSTAVYSGPRFGKRWHYTVVDTVLPSSTTSTISGLTPFSSTKFTVQAIDAAGNRSLRSPHLVGTTLSAPTLTFQFGTQTTGTIQSPARTPIEIRLYSRANPAPTFSMVSGPADIVVDPVTGLVQWTPGVADIGLHTAIFQATNSVGSTDLSISIDVIPDAPQLSITLNPTTGDRFAVAGTLFTAQVSDASGSPSTYSLVTAPVGMTIDPLTGLISWTPTGDQGGIHTITVNGTNAGGSADLSIDVPTRFTGAVSTVTVTGATQLYPTVTWVAPTGEGAGLVTGYKVNAYARWKYGSHTHSYRSHTMNYVATAGSETVDLTGLITGKTYTITITPVDAAGNEGLGNNSATVVPAPALPIMVWTVNGYSGGLSVPGPVVAGQPMEIVLADQRPDPSDIVLVSGPAGLNFDPVSKTAHWTPGAADVNTGYLTTDVMFRATNSIGSVEFAVPVHVYFSGAVRNLQATNYDNIAASARWDVPTDNVTPIAGYQVTMHWTWSGRRRSRSWTVGGNVTSINYSLIPTGAVVHKGVSIVPIDANGNLGFDLGKVLYGQRANSLPPIAVGDAYTATEDTTLTVDFVQGVRANDIDTDNTPLINPLTARLVAGPTNGTLALGSLGSFTYTPKADFNGIDTFTYVAYDGKFTSNVATVTITVDSVNDAPTGVDDYYTVDQDQALDISAATGVLVNDSDVDGDALTVSVVGNPANGSVSLNPDGSFVYTPKSGFFGADTFTYLASDLLLDSRLVTATVTVNQVIAPSAGTKFFVVDFDGQATFEYQADGSLQETYGLAPDNKKSMGVATNKDGSLVWVADKDNAVYIYNDAGNELGMWIPDGLDKPDGIATDGTDIWIVDREIGRVFYFAGGAALRSGSTNATSSFSLEGSNEKPKGITTDGSSLWIVNDGGGTDTVFKYTTSGALLGSWTIDAANASPTGITIDPNNVNDIWIVDSLSDRVYEYTAAADHTSGVIAASSSFALDAANANPQGIADPRPSVSTTAERAIERMTFPYTDIRQTQHLHLFESDDQAESEQQSFASVVAGLDLRPQLSDPNSMSSVSTEAEQSTDGVSKLLVIEPGRANIEEASVDLLFGDFSELHAILD